MKELTDTQIQLMQMVAASLFSGTWNPQEKTDWIELRHEAVAQSVFTPIYPVAEAALPPEEQVRWSRTFYIRLANNIRVGYEHTELHRLLEQEKIPYVTLKGAASASYYPRPEMREMGDVDFLVREEDRSRAGQLLESIGFAPKEDKGGIHVAYHRAAEKGSTCSVWEMHREVNGIPHGSSTGELIRAYMADVLETSVDYEEENGTVKVPDVFHHGLILLLHTASHLTGEGVGLRHLCDWLVFADHFSEPEFTEMFEDRLKKAGLWRFAQMLTLCGVRYLGCPPKAWAGEASEELLGAMICDIFEGGNFGKKSPERSRQIKYIVDRNDRTVGGKGAVRQVFAAIDHKARTEYGFVKRVPALLPVGWICTVVQYLELVLRGERQMDSKETRQKAAVRKQIYRQFQLFETEET